MSGSLVMRRTRPSVVGGADMGYPWANGKALLNIGVAITPGSIMATRTLNAPHFLRQALAQSLEQRIWRQRTGACEANATRPATEHTLDGDPNAPRVGPRRPDDRMGACMAPTAAILAAR